MKVIRPIVTIEPINGLQLVKNIERYSRICYKSCEKITEDSYKTFLAGILKRGHLSVIEHEKVTAVVVCDRGVSHEIVRHRIGSYSQESTRYINYKEGITVIEPLFWPSQAESHEVQMKNEFWRSAMEHCEEMYKELIIRGATPEQARTVLPNSLATELAITYNLREWRHFFDLRGSPSAHPQIREIAVELLKLIKDTIPILFDDYNINEKEKLIHKKV